MRCRCSRVNSLAICHQQHFQRYCGTDAASVMDVLLRRALADPVFLRFRYRPHCASHAASTTLTFTTASLTSDRPSTIFDSTTGDRLTTLNSAENLTSVTLEVDSSRQLRAGISGGGSVAFNTVSFGSVFLIAFLCHQLVNCR